MKEAAPDSNRAHKMTPRDTLEKLRTMNGRFTDFPPSEIPERTLRSLQKGAKHVGPMILAGGIAANIAPVHAGDTREPHAAVEQHDTAKLALDSLIHDVVRSGTIEEFRVKALSAYDISCLARNVFHEARGEGFEGQLATVLVALARTQDKRFPSSPCGVVYQKNQFSWTNDKKILLAQKERSIEPIYAALNDLLLNQQISEAVELLASLLKLPTKTLYYKRTDWDENDETNTRMSSRSRAMWKKLKAVRTIGNHTFYTD